MTDFEIDKMYTITGRELLALLSLIFDGDEKAKAILDNVAGREKSGKVNESQIDFLKPCPFCGNHRDNIYIGVFWEDHDDPYFVTKCHECGASGPYAKEKEKAIESWNRRVKE